MYIRRKKFITFFELNVKLFWGGIDTGTNVGRLYVFRRYISCQLKVISTFRYYFLLQDKKILAFALTLEWKTSAIPGDCRRKVMPSIITSVPYWTCQGSIWMETNKGTRSLAALFIGFYNLRTITYFLKITYLAPITNIFPHRGDVAVERRTRKCFFFLIEINSFHRKCKLLQNVTIYFLYIVSLLSVSYSE